MGNRLSASANNPNQIWGKLSLLLIGYCGLFTQDQSSQRSVNHWPPSSNEVQNECSYISTLSYAFMVCTGTTVCLLFYFFRFPSSQFQFHTPSQFTTADLILMCHCIQMRLSFMKKQFCESGRYILSIMMLQSHCSWHLTWTGPYRGQSKECTITVHCGSLLWPIVSETDFIWPHTLNFHGWKHDTSHAKTALTVEGTRILLGS